LRFLCVRKWREGIQKIGDGGDDDADDDDDDDDDDGNDDDDDDDDDHDDDNDDDDDDDDDDDYESVDCSVPVMLMTCTSKSLTPLMHPETAAEKVVYASTFVSLNLMVTFWRM
jgi:hypothetical protein